MLKTVNSRGYDLNAMFKALPKIDLHRHLEGSLRLSTLAEIASRNGVDMQTFDIEELRPLVQVVNDEPNFQEFLAKFAVLRKFYSTREAILRIAYEAVADAAVGEFERLKEFGIKAKSEGDKVTFLFKGVSTTVGKNAAEIETFLQTR